MRGTIGRMMSLVLLTVIIVFAVSACSPPAQAFGLDSITGWAKGAGWSAIAMVLTGLILVFGLAARAQWLSALIMAIGALVMGFGEIFYAVGAALQDGKIDADELKAIKREGADIGGLFRSVVTVFKGGASG